MLSQIRFIVFIYLFCFLIPTTFLDYVLYIFDVHKKCVFFSSSTIFLRLFFFKIPQECKDFMSSFTMNSVKFCLKIFTTKLNVVFF